MAPAVMNYARRRDELFNRLVNILGSALLAVLVSPSTLSTGGAERNVLPIARKCAECKPWRMRHRGRGSGKARLVPREGFGHLTDDLTRSNDGLTKHVTASERRLRWRSSLSGGWRDAAPWSHDSSTYDDNRIVCLQLRHRSLAYRRAAKTSSASTRGSLVDASGARSPA
jgi:hypothetical protein